jgi:hypothetical protein
LWKLTAVMIVIRNRAMMRRAPRFIGTFRELGERFEVRHRSMHQDGGHQPVDEGRHKEGEKAEEVDDAFLPDHERRDVAEGAEGATCVCGNHDVDAGQGHEARVVAADGQYDCTHQQCSGQIIGDRRDRKGQTTQ